MNWYWLLTLLIVACSQQETHFTDFEKWVEQHGTQFSILIQNGIVYDGQDSDPRRADLLIRGDTIAYIGVVDTSLIEVEQVIDAAGKVVTPGFIDTHAHGNPLETPDFANFLAMGVTTICLGQDGSSPAPEYLPVWMDSVAAVGPGVNIAMWIGHGSLRQSSGVGFTPDPSPEALSTMQQQLAAAMEAGCFGMSTGLEYTPGRFATEAELVALAEVVGDFDGVIMSHLRSEDDTEIEAALAELLQQAQYCNVHVSHLKVVYGKGADRAEALLEKIFGSSHAHRVTADLYPYLASYTGIGIVFPDWAKAPHDYQQVRQARRDELLTYLRERVAARNGPEATLLGTGPHAGKTLAQLSRELEMPYEEVLLEMGPQGASAAYFVMDDALQERLLAAPGVAVCSDGSTTMYHPRGYGSFAKIIEEYVNRRKTLTLAEAIHKMSRLPAQILGLADRGCLAPGCRADILVFDPSAVQAKATYEAPHQLATGFDYVLVNGRLAVENGKVLSKRSGKVLLKNRD